MSDIQTKGRPKNDESANESTVGTQFLAIVAGVFAGFAAAPVLGAPALVAGVVGAGLAYGVANLPGGTATTSPSAKAKAEDKTEAEEKAAAEKDAEAKAKAEAEAKAKEGVKSTYKSTVDSLNPLKVKGLLESKNMLINIENASTYPDLMVHDEVEITGLVKRDKWYAKISKVNTERPPNPLATISRDASNIKLVGGRATSHIGQQQIYLSGNDRLPTTVNVTEGWVKQKNLEERPISEWEQGKWKFQIIIDQKNWQRYHIMFDIVGGEIRVFHVGPGG